MSSSKKFATEADLKKLSSYIIFDSETGAVKRVVFPNSIQVGLPEPTFSSARITISGTVESSSGFTGSLSNLPDGRSYLRAGTNVTITSASDGQLTISAVGGSGSPGGSDTQLQFNDGGAFGGISAFTWDDTDLQIGTNTKLQFRDSQIFLNSSTNGQLDIDADGEVEISTAKFDLDASSDFDIQGGAASAIATTSGDLTIEAGATTAKLVLKGDHESSVAIHLDGNAATDSIIQIDAGHLDIDATDKMTLDASNEIEVTTTSADGHITLHSAHVAGDAVIIDANAHADAVLNIDAGKVDIDAQGTIDIDGTGISLDSDASSNFSTSGGTLTLEGKTGVLIKEDGTGIISVDDDRDVEIQNARIIDIDASGLVTIDSSNGQIRLGSGNNDQDISIGADGTRTIQVGAGDGTSTTTINSRGGTLTLDGTGQTVDLNSAALDVDASGRITIHTSDAAADIELVTAHTSGRAFYLDADANAGSIVDIDAGILQIDATGVASINSGGTLSLGTANSGVAVSIGHGTSETTINDNLTVSGNAGIGVSDPDQKLEVAGAVHISGEITSPSAPSNGDGGILYVKADGKPYWISNEVGETDLSSGGGGGSGDYQSKSSNFSVGTSEYMFGVDTTSGAVTATLPACASAGAGKQYIFKDVAGQAGSNNISIATNGSETIDGAGSANIMVASGSMTLMTDGSNWFIIGIA